MHSFVLPDSPVLFQLTSVSNNYTAALVEHFQIVLVSAIILLFGDFLVCLPCMVAFILHSVSRFGDILDFYFEGFSECTLPFRAH